MCSRCVRTVSMLSKSFVEIYSHSMEMTRAVYTGLHAANFAHMTVCKHTMRTMCPHTAGVASDQVRDLMQAHSRKYCF